MQIILHIGQSKTGTSAIQAFLTLNRNALRKAGVIYPSVNVGGVSVDLGNHNALADSLCGLSRYPYLTADEYFAQFFREASSTGAERMILSAEHFFGGEPRVWDVASEQAYWIGYRNKIAALAPYLEGHAVTLIAYLRPQIDWLVSAICQTIRSERLISDKPIYKNDRQFFEMAKPLLRYAQLVDAWVQGVQPQNTIVVPYARVDLYRRSSIADFVRRAGLEGLDLPFGGKSLQVNTSLSCEFIELKKDLNRQHKSKTAERVTIACLERLSACHGLGIPYRLSEDLADEVSEFSERENAWVNDRYVPAASKLTSASGSGANEGASTVSKDDVANARALFDREYRSLGTRIQAVDFAFRAFLRTHARPLHGILHQFKRAYRSHRYRR